MLFKLFNFFAVLLILFSQILSIQEIVYPLLITFLVINLFLYYHKYDYRDYNKLFFYLLIATIVIFSSFIRNADFNFLIYNFRYFFGLGLIIICFHFNKFYFSKYHLYMLCLVPIYEVISLNIGIDPFFYNIADLESEFFKRRSVFFEIQIPGPNIKFYSAIGITYNSSISALLNVFLFGYLVINYKKKLLFLKTILAITSLLYISTAGILCLIFIIFVTRFQNFRDLTFFLLFILALIFTLLFANQFVEIISGIDIDNLQRVLGDKLKTIDEITIKEFIIGRDLLFLPSSLIGGDFALFNMIQMNGFIISLSFIIYLILFFNNKSFVFLFLGIFFSLHYGVIFHLAGQIIFGGILSQNIITRKNLFNYQMKNKPIKKN